METIKKRIQKWWNSSPCCSRRTYSPWGSKSFFEEVDSYKNTREPFTDQIADYCKWKGKKVLEIGVGLGKDFSRFAANGAIATGIDLSEKSIELTKGRLEIFKLKGNFCLADAENLPFKDESFDLIFSWGVLHHTPDTQRAINEAYRCLKARGHIIVMLYNKHSLANFSYFIIRAKVKLISILGFRFLFTIKKLIFPWNWFKKTRDILNQIEKLNDKELLAALTDGVGNPLSKVYSAKEARLIFSKFTDIKIQAYESKGSPSMRVFNLFKKSEKYLGWFLVIKAKK